MVLKAQRHALAVAQETNHLLRQCSYRRADLEMCERVACSLDQPRPYWLGNKSEWVFDSACKRGLPSGGVRRRPALFTDSNGTEKLSAIAEPERNQTPMNNLIHFI